MQALPYLCAFQTTASGINKPVKSAAAARKEIVFTWWMKHFTSWKKIKGMSVGDQIKGLQNPMYHRSIVNGTSWANHSVSWSLQPYFLDIGNRGYPVGYNILNRLLWEALLVSYSFLQQSLFSPLKFSGFHNHSSTNSAYSLFSYFWFLCLKEVVYSRCPVIFDFWIGERGLVFDSDKIYL